jgi:hypothetical protein
MSDDVMTNSMLAEMFVEFKWSHNDALFGNICVLDTNCQTFLNDTKVILDTLGQITTYVTAGMGGTLEHYFVPLVLVRQSQGP